jgi:hypothetical protein
MPRTDRASLLLAVDKDHVFAALTDRDSMLQWLPPRGKQGRFEIEPRTLDRRRAAAHMYDDRIRWFDVRAFCGRAPAIGMSSGMHARRTADATPTATGGPQR